MLALLCLAFAAVSADDLDTIAQRAALSALPPPSTLPAFDAQVALNLTYLTPQFFFSDLNYSFCLNADWPAMMHAERTLNFVSAYASPGSAYYHSAPLLASVHGLLAYWLQFNAAHRSTNWWMNQVGVPSFLGHTGLLLQQLGQLQPAELAGVLASTRQADTYRGGCEPTNCLWLAGNVLLGGLLARNASLVARTSTDIFSTINLRNPLAPSDPSGIKADGSFMMHGSLLYSGGYGMCYAKGLIDLLAWTRGTAYALPPQDSRWELLSHYLLDGTLRMMHYGTPLPPYGPATWDPSALGRNYARPYGHDPGSAAGQAVTIAVEALAGVGGPRAAEFLAFAALLNGTGALAGVPPAFLAFSAHFYQADYTMHTAPLAAEPASPQLPSWTASVFAASSRTRRSEITNAEGVQSWHMAENALWVQVSGQEYLDAWPAMDMGLIPGTTILPLHAYSSGDIGGMGATAFVGGAANQGASLAVNDFVAPNHVGLAYRKATALLPSAVVALTANITADSPLAPVRTVLAQRRAEGGACVGPASAAPLPVPMAGVYVSSSGSGGGGSRALPVDANETLDSSVWWVWEGGVGYLLLDRLPGAAAGAAAGALPTLHVSSLVQNGSWAKLGVWQDWTACNIFSLYAQHAPPVAGAQAAFAVAPGVSLQAWSASNSSSGSGSASALAAALTVLNSPALQAVHLAGEGVLAAAVYDPAGGQAAVPGYTASFSSAGAFVLREQGQGQGSAWPGLSLGAAQPLQAPWEGRVEVRGQGLPPPTAGAANCSAVQGGYDIVLAHPPSDGSTVLVGC